MTKRLSVLIAVTSSDTQTQNCVRRLTSLLLLLMRWLCPLKLQTRCSLTGPLGHGQAIKAQSPSRPCWQYWLPPLHPSRPPRSAQRDLDTVSHQGTLLLNLANYAMELSVSLCSSLLLWDIW